VGNAPFGIAFDGTNMWVTNNGSENVTELSKTGATLGTFATLGGPQGIAFDGTHLWITDGQQGTVIEL
jgi:DNA-binding beta-propeller fold protein YncE